MGWVREGGHASLEVIVKVDEVGQARPATGTGCVERHLR